MYKCMLCDNGVLDTATDDTLCADCWVERNNDKPPCAWCYPGSAGNSIGSHGICRAHADAMVAEAFQTMTPVSDGWGYQQANGEGGNVGVPSI